MLRAIVQVTLDRVEVGLQQPIRNLQLQQAGSSCAGEDGVRHLLRQRCAGVLQD